VTLKDITIRDAHFQPDGNAPGAAQRPRVLVVDDDVSLARLLKTILRSADFDVSTAQDGSAALDLLLDRQFDAIVMDLRMPVLDGRSLYRELRARGDDTPVLIASAFGARAAQRELGADGAIEKPFEPDDLVAAVENLVRIRSHA
jgi:DNA-binding response OmpR family regulator